MVEYHPKETDDIKGLFDWIVDAIQDLDRRVKVLERNQKE